MGKYFHSFHMVTISPWPLLVGVGSFNLVVSVLGYLNNLEHGMWVSLINILLVLGCWWRDVIRESTFQGEHSLLVVSGLMIGMLLFIVSEVFFFLSFFWSYFHFSLSPEWSLGVFWPPTGIEIFNPFQVPLLNTVILLSSGVSVTWAHQAILMNNYKAGHALAVTWGLGIYFLSLQGYEYYDLGVSISDSNFGSVFFMATGFHGFHVLVGTALLIIMFIRLMKGHFSEDHHFGFEAAAWYWHFVDVVWLFLFSVVYWWGS